jgi:hypothetical protein
MSVNGGFGNDSLVSPDEWLRTPEPFLPGDRIQLALINDGGDTRTGDLRVCLAPATDDFGQKDMEKACGAPGYPSSLPNNDLQQTGKFRRTLVWNGRKTTGFILLRAGCGACGLSAANPTITLERQVHLVRLGSPSARRSGRKWIVSVSARLTDNSPAPNGHRAKLEVGFDGGPLRLVARGAVSGGFAKLAFRSPAKAKVATVRVCTTPIGSAAKVCSTRIQLRLRS